MRERAALVVGVVDALKAMGADIAEELAWQMGRPIRYGQGELRGVEERARYMAAIAEEALAPMRPMDDRPGFERYVAREPRRPRVHDRALELPVSRPPSIRSSRR